MEVLIENYPVKFYPNNNHKGHNGKYFIDEDYNFFLKKCPYRNINREAKITKLLNKHSLDWCLKLVKHTKTYIITLYLKNSSYLTGENLPENYRDQLDVILNDMKKLGIRHNDIHLKQFRVVDSVIYLTDFGWGSFNETSEFKIPNSDMHNAYTSLDNLYNKYQSQKLSQIRILPYFSSIFVGKSNINDMVLKIILPPNFSAAKYLEFSGPRDFDISHNIDYPNCLLNISYNQPRWDFSLEINHNLIYVENNELELSPSKKNTKKYILLSKKKLPKKIKCHTRNHDNPTSFRYQIQDIDRNTKILIVKRTDKKSGWKHIIPIKLEYI